MLPPPADAVPSLAELLREQLPVPVPPPSVLIGSASPPPEANRSVTASEAGSALVAYWISAPR